MVVARYGVGYDAIDVDTCTGNGVAVTNSPDGIRRAMATAMMTLILALGGRLLQNDRLTRRGHWAEMLDSMGGGPA